MTAAILAFGIMVSLIKAKQTNRAAFVPALFLMIVMTTIEWVPGMRTEGTDYATIMIITLLACNTYQLLALTRLSKVDDDQGKRHNKTTKAKDRKSTRLNSSHVAISYAVFCLENK